MAPGYWTLSCRGMDGSLHPARTAVNRKKLWFDPFSFPTTRWRWLRIQAIGMDLEPGFLASFCQRLEEILPVHIVQIDVLLAVPAAHDVVNSPRILDSELSRHGQEPAPSSNCCQRGKLWFDPFRLPLQAVAEAVSQLHPFCCWACNTLGLHSSSNSRRIEG